MGFKVYKVQKELQWIGVDYSMWYTKKNVTGIAVNHIIYALKRSVLH